MGKILRFIILLIFISVAMSILNSIVLGLLFGIDADDQLNALTSLAVAGSFPGTYNGTQGKGSVQQGTTDLQSREDPRSTAGQQGTTDPQGAGRSEGTGGHHYSTGGMASQARDEEASGQNGDDCFITLEEIGLLENMGLQDKLKAVSILSRVDREILDSAVKMAGDGITYEEYDELKHSVEAYLDTEDIKTLEEILDRNRDLYAQGSN